MFKACTKFHYPLFHNHIFPEFKKWIPIYKSFVSYGKVAVAMATMSVMTATAAWR